MFHKRDSYLMVLYDRRELVTLVNIMQQLNVFPLASAQILSLFLKVFFNTEKEPKELCTLRIK